MYSIFRVLKLSPRQQAALMDQPSVLAMLSRVVVTLPQLGGQGVQIVGGFVLTAAHSLPGKVLVGGAAPSTGW